MSDAAQRWHVTSYGEWQKDPEGDVVDYDEHARVVSDLSAELVRTREALIGVIPDSNNPENLCWCPSYRDVRVNGHSLKCAAARAALEGKG